MNTWKSNLNAIPLGMYEKALSDDLTWPQRLAAAREANFDFVEISIDDSDERISRLDWDAPQRSMLRQASGDSGIPIKSMSLSSHRRFPLGSLDDQTRKKGIDIFKKAIEFAVDTGIRYILLAGIDVYYEDSTEQTREHFLKGLESGFEWATQAGVVLALENWDIRLDSLSKVMTYVNYFNSPWFQAYVDIGNLAYAGHDVLAELELARGHIAAVHVKDTLRGQLRYVSLGEGIVPFREAFSRLAEVGFQGPVALELWTAEFPNALEIVTAGNAWIRTRMEEGWRAYNKDLKE